MANTDSLTQALRINAAQPILGVGNFFVNTIRTWDLQVAINLAGNIATVHERVYNGTAINSQVINLLNFRAMKSGVITRIDLYTEGVVGSGDAFFNVVRAGETLFSGNNRIKINSTNKTVVKTTNFAISRGDLITLNLDEIPTSLTVLPPIVIILDIV